MQTHPWRLVDAKTGATLQEVVASKGEQTVRIGDSQFAAELDAPAPREVPSFTGFDGIGGNHSDYGAAEVCFRHHEVACSSPDELCRLPLIVWA